MSHNRILISFFLLNTIAFSQEDVPFDISKQFDGGLIDAFKNQKTKFLVIYV